MKLNWKQANIREPITYRAAVDGQLDETAWEETAVQVWRFFTAEIAPLNDATTWEVVRCDFWMDTGRLLVFVAQADMEERIDKGVCEIVSMEFADTWNRCASAHGDSDAQFVKALLKAQRRYAAVFSRVLERLIRAGECQSLKGREVQFWNAGDELVASEQF